MNKVQSKCFIVSFGTALEKQIFFKLKKISSSAVQVLFTYN